MVNINEKPSEVTDSAWLYARFEEPKMSNNKPVKIIYDCDLNLKNKKEFNKDFPNYKYYKEELEAIGDDFTNIDGNNFKKINGIWFYSENLDYSRVEFEFSGGKWLIFGNISETDDNWAIIKQAIEEGKLRTDAKVSTAKPSPNAMDSERTVICVYTDDDDIFRIRNELKKLGFTQKIPYKTTKATWEGRYQKRGHKKISNYFE